MSSATVSGSTTGYLYNALGQLIYKTNSTGATILVYDESGHLLGEYSASGALIQETVWMGDIPVATLRPNGSSISIYYVHTDHLGSARKVTRPSDNGLMWRWDPDTFGGNTSTPNQNPAGLGNFVYNLRFPGQYYQAETGLYYNYFRDYDPQTGRYVESDPIGLRGGSYSTYSYVNNNPISRIDPLGLYVQIIGSDPIVTAQLQAAYNAVANTLTGAVWTSVLESSTLLYTIMDNPLAPNNAYFDPNVNVISIDPNFHPVIPVDNACGREAASTAVIMAHELAHAATGALDNGPGWMNNVNWNENVIRPQLGLPLRTAYPTLPPFSYSSPSPW